MHVITARGINQAYVMGLDYLGATGVISPSRNGPVLVCPHPVTTVYTHPRERVLLDPKRDANPFLHLMDALHILAGRNDAAIMVRYAKQIAVYAEPDGHLHGAYGYRWRHHFDLEGGGNPNMPDQIATVIKLLRADHNDRRVVLQMWDPAADLGQAERRDLPCNLCVLPRIVDGKLDLTTISRSHDIVWGCYGANVVQFTLLQEYLAAFIGVGIGKYYQISNNYHAYVNIFEKVWPTSSVDQRYEDAYFCSKSLVRDKSSFDGELWLLLERVKQDQFEVGPDLLGFRNEFLSHIAYPLFAAHWAYRRQAYAEIQYWLSRIVGLDWRTAAEEWFMRRKQKQKQKEEAT